MTQTMTREQMIEHDTRTAALHKQQDQIFERIAHIEDKAHKVAGDKRRWAGRTPYWAMSLIDALAKAPAESGARDTLFAELAPVQAQIRELDEIYRRSPWIRFFPSVTKSQPHIHASLHCRTLYATTIMRWEPKLSGRTYDEAVAELDEALCSVCFPDAPVALHTYVSRKSKAERAARDNAAIARMAAKAAKTLTEAEQFRDGDGHRVTTVAACKQLIRDAITYKVELAWWMSDATSKPGWSDEQLANKRRHFTEMLAGAERDAATAEKILLARHREDSSWGASAEEIAKMRANAEKRARKDWEI